jgi:hypothetical protein
MKINGLLDILRNSFGYIPGLIANLSEKKYAGVYISVCYAAVIMPLGLLLHTSGSYYITSENDFFSSYIPHAESLLNGNFVVDVYRGPLYVLLLASIKYLINNFMSAGIIISSLSSAIFLYFTYLLLKKIFSGSVALVVLIFTTINPIFIAYSYAPGTDMFFAALCAISVYLFLTAGKNTHIKIIGSAFFAALAFLTRYNAIFLMTIPVLIILTGIMHKKYKERITSGIIFLMVFLCTAAPWGIYTYINKGEFFYNENYRNIAITLGNIGKLNWEKEWHSNAGKYGSFSDIVKEEPVLLAETITGNFVQHSFKNLLVLNTFYIGIFSVIGLLFFKINRLNIKQFSYYLVNAAFFILLLPVFYDPRFFLFLLPVLSVFAYFGIKSVSDFSSVTQGFIFNGLICFGILSSISYNKQLIIGQEEIKNIESAFHISENNNISDKIIASRMPHISYQLNMKWEALPAGKTIAETIAELKRKNVDYLYFSRREYNEREQLRALINPYNAPPGLQPVIYLRKDRAVLYKIEDGYLL